MLLRPGEVNREKHWFEFHNLDKIVHFLIFTVLGFCYSVSFPKQKKMAFCGGDVCLCTIHGGCTGTYEYGADDGFL